MSRPGSPTGHGQGRMRVAVVGGGLAGITAALRCADALGRADAPGGAGHEVVLLESRARLGGVAGSFERAGLAVDTGQHVFLRCCTAYRALLERIGAADAVTIQERLDIPVLRPGLRATRLRRTGLPAPLHLGRALAGYRPLPLPDRLRVLRGALALRTVRPDDPATDAQSFGSWLAAHGQRAQAVTALWDLVGIATLNARAADASLALAATVFQLGLLTDAAAGDIGWARLPLGALHDTAARGALETAGVTVRRSARVRAINAVTTTTRQATPGQEGARWSVRFSGTGTGDRSGTEEELVVDRIISAVPPGAAEQLLPPGAVDLPAGWAARLGSTPIVNVHVVYDRTVLTEPFAAGVGTPVQWVFDRTASSGAGTLYGPAAQYLAVSLSAADDIAGLPAAALRAEFLPALARLLPAAAQARVLEFFVTREPHATFRAAPGSAALRPPARSGLAGLYLAGAWTATGWPATMEGAVRSGTAAAEALLAESAPARQGVAA